MVQSGEPRRVRVGIRVAVRFRVGLRCRVRVKLSCRSEMVQSDEPP